MRIDRDDPELGHLPDDAYYSMCQRCWRRTYERNAEGTLCDMRQPDSSRCTGHFGPLVDPRATSREHRDA